MTTAAKETHGIRSLAPPRCVCGWSDGTCDGLHQHLLWMTPADEYRKNDAQAEIDMDNYGRLT